MSDQWDKAKFRSFDLELFSYKKYQYFTLKITQSVRTLNDYYKTLLVPGGPKFNNVDMRKKAFIYF